MFTLMIHGNNPTNPLKVRIDGCPDSGLEAIDFRRQVGLPEEPTDLIDLPPASIVNEQAARQLPLNGNADFEANHRFRQAYTNSWGELCMRYPSNSGSENRPSIAPDIIAGWLKEQNALNAYALYCGVMEIDRREREKSEAIRAEAIAAGIAKEKALNDARELLKDEIAKKDSRITYLEGELAEAREKIEELETESV